MQTGDHNPSPLKELGKLVPYQYQIGKKIKLSIPQDVLNVPFYKVLLHRRSKRNFTTLSIEKISHLLWYAAKARKITVAANNFLLSQRSSPSAGAIHPIDILISMPSSMIERKFSYYDPFNHVLEELNLEKNKVIQFLEHINYNLNITNATIIWFVAHLNRTGSFYTNPESLVWKDAGAITMTFQLVATATNICCCPLGTLGSPYLENLFNNEKNIFSAGGILLG